VLSECKKMPKNYHFVKKYCQKFEKKTVFFFYIQMEIPEGQLCEYKKSELYLQIVYLSMYAASLNIFYQFVCYL